MSIPGDAFQSAEFLNFEIVGVDAYHLVAADQTYWRDFQAGDRVATKRFLLKPGWRTVYARHVETAIVKVTLADGSIGWGEAAEPICPEVICRLAANLIAPLLGATGWASPGEFWKAGYDLNRCRGHHSGYQLLALAAVEGAIWDALGRRVGLPVAALLAGNPANSLEIYASGLRQGSLGERVEVLRRTVDEGVAGAKIFVGGDTGASLAELSGLRGGVPGMWKLMVDALWSYETVASAVEARNRFAEFDVNWLECPLVSEDFEGHCELAGADGVPVALGEHFFTHHQSTPWMRARALDVFQPDICRTGFSDGLVQAGMAREAGIRVTPHMGSGSPVVQAAALSFAAACHADEPCEYQFDLANLLPDVFETAWKRHDGKLEVPDVPGLGISVLEEALARSSLTRESWRAD